MDQLNPKPASSPPKKKLHTYHRIVVMEGGDEDMELDVITQWDDKLIRTESDWLMEDRNELDFEQVLNQEPLHVQETSAPIK